MKRRKAKIVINNRLKGSFGAMNPKTNKVEINVKSHKGDRAELASTIKHELLHVNKPKMTEKQVYKKSAKTKIPEGEQLRLVAKLRNKSRNYKLGALKRRYKLGRGDTKPGDLINLVNRQKEDVKSNNQPISKTRLSIMGLV